MDVNEGFVVEEVIEAKEEVVAGNENEEIVIEDEELDEVEKEFDEIEIENDDENINNYFSSTGAPLSSEWFEEDDASLHEENEYVTERSSEQSEAEKLKEIRCKMKAEWFRPSQ